MCTGHQWISLLCKLSWYDVYLLWSLLTCSFQIKAWIFKVGVREEILACCISIFKTMTFIHKYSYHSEFPLNYFNRWTISREGHWYSTCFNLRWLKTNNEATWHCCEPTRLSLTSLFDRVAQNEEIFEKCVSLCGLVFLLVQKAMKKCFLKKYFIFRGPPRPPKFNTAALWD